MKIAFIHNEKRLGTGAHYINDLMSQKLKQAGVITKNFYPSVSLVEAPIHMGGLRNILFFYSLLEKRREIMKFDFVQGTSYTALPFLAYPIPVVSHFGSTTIGFLKNTPLAKDLEAECKKVWQNLKTEGVIKELNIKTRRPLRDIADIEGYVARNAEAVIATSEKVRQELLSIGVCDSKIYLIHNAIEDYWLENEPTVKDFVSNPGLVFLGRLGGDSFTLKLKGLDRLVHLFQKFPNIPKNTFCITNNKRITSWLTERIPNHKVLANTTKDKLPGLLKPLKGSILFIPSRYEGFSLSLIEGMSQGLVPVIYSVGVAPEIIKNGENGFVVSSQDEAAKRVEEILADEKLRLKLSNQAKETAANFSSDKIVKDLIKLYTKVKKVPKGSLICG